MSSLVKTKKPTKLISRMEKEKTQENISPLHYAFSLADNYVVIISHHKIDLANITLHIMH